MIGCQVSDAPRWDSTRRDRTLSRGTPQAEDLLTQYVARYGSGDAARYLDQVRARVNTCKPDNGKSIKVTAQRFAGQDARASRRAG